MSEVEKDLYDQLEDCFDDDMHLIKAHKFTRICAVFEYRLAKAEEERDRLNTLLTEIQRGQAV